MPSVIFVNTGIYRAERRVDSRIHGNDELTDWGCLNSSGYGHASKPNTFCTSRIEAEEFGRSNSIVNENLALSDLPIIQKTYDLIKWYVPILNRLPRDHKFALGERITAGLYDLLEGPIQVRYTKEKLAHLKALNIRLEVLRHQTRLLLDFQILSARRYEYVGQQMNGIGMELGGWIKQQQQAATVT
jgi:hypothetical protein